MCFTVWSLIRPPSTRIRKFLKPHIFKSTFLCSRVGKGAGFYLGYLRARSFPPPKKNSSPPPPNILLSLQYISNYIGKIIQTQRGHCTWTKYSLSKDTIWQGTWSRLKNKIKYYCNISQNCASKCTRLHLSVYSFQNISGRGMPPDPAMELVASGHSGLLPQTIS